MQSKQKQEAPTHSSAIRKKAGVSTMPRQCDYTPQFIKDVVKAKHSGRHDMTLLNMVLQLIVNNEGPLDPIWKSHELTGEWKGMMELHVKGDLLLIYELDNSAPKGIGSVVFVRLGSHSELFG